MFLHDLARGACRKRVAFTRQVRAGDRLRDRGQFARNREAFETANDAAVRSDRDVGSRAAHAVYREHVADPIDHRDRRGRALRLRFVGGARDDLRDIGGCEQRCRVRARTGTAGIAAARRWIGGRRGTDGAGRIAPTAAAAQTKSPGQQRTESWFAHHSPPRHSARSARATLRNEYNAAPRHRALEKSILDFFITMPVTAYSRHWRALDRQAPRHALRYLAAEMTSLPKGSRNVFISSGARW